MLTKIWGLLCLCGCLAACGETNDPSELTPDANLPAHMDTDMMTSDMEQRSDQFITTDATVPMASDMFADMAIQADMTLSSDMGQLCTDDCMTEPLTWGRIGGLTPYDVVYTLTPCNTQVVQINSFTAVDPDALRCERIAPGCNAQARITLPEVITKLGEVLSSSAFEFGEVYGQDSRPVDGQVFSIVFGDQEVLIGDPCEGGGANCTPPPPEVVAFADLLWDFGRAMENEEPTCAHLRDGL